MKSNLRVHPNYAWMEADYDVFLLLRRMQTITFKSKGHKNQLHALHNAKAEFYTFRQGYEFISPQFLELFQSKVSVVEQFGSSIGTDPGLVLAKYPVILTDPSNPTEDKTELAALLDRDRYLGVVMLFEADPTH